MPIPPPPAASDVDDEEDDVDVDGSVIDDRVAILGVVMENAWTTATALEKRMTRSSSLFIMMIVTVAVEEEDILYGVLELGCILLHYFADAMVNGNGVMNEWRRRFRRRV